ncbi:MAG: choice-of-anchor M domain-containing protein [Phycisphaerales bacterium JB058]
MRYLTAAALSAAAASSVFAQSVQTAGHTDIRFLYNSSTGDASIDYHLGAGSVVDGVSLAADTAYATTDLITYIPDPAVARPGGAAWDFTGNSAGDPLWYIPFSQEVDRPWTGISTESVSSADFSNISYELTAFFGPGEMSVVTFGPFGDPTIYFQTSNGLSSADVISVPAGTHAHFAWFFTEMGTYTFDLTVTGALTPGAGGGTVSATDTFTFQVVPAPASIALLGLSGVATLRRRRTAVL